MRKVLTVSFNQSNWPVACEFYKFHWALQQISDNLLKTYPTHLSTSRFKTGCSDLVCLRRKEICWGLSLFITFAGPCESSLLVWFLRTDWLRAFLLPLSLLLPSKSHLTLVFILYHPCTGCGFLLGLALVGWLTLAYLKVASAYSQVTSEHRRRLSFLWPAYPAARLTFITCLIIAHLRQKSHEPLAH